MWLIFTFASAFATGLQNVAYKKAHITIPSLVMIWCVLLVSSVLFSPLLLLGIPPLNWTFFFAVIMRVIFDTLALTLYVKGIRMSPLSLTTPMLAIQPLALIVTQFFFNHLLPNGLGFVGISLCVFGIYFLNFDHDTGHLLSPFHAIFKEKGVLLVACTAVLWSFVVSFQKLAIDNSSVFFYTAFFQIVWFLFLTPLVFVLYPTHMKSLFPSKKFFKLTPPGIFDALQVFFQYVAFTLAQPVYVIAVSRVDIFFSSFFGWIFFKEKIHKHIIPTIIIVVGIICITVAQK